MPPAESETYQSGKLEHDLFFIAIIINVVGNFIDSIGWCIQKYAHMKIQKNNSNESFVKDTTWWIGFAVHAGGSVIAKLSYAFGPASLLLPLDTLKIVFTTGLAAKYLGEKVSHKEIIGIIIIVLAAAISTVFGPRSLEAFYTIDQLAVRFEQTAFLVVAGILSGYTLLNYLILRIDYPFNPFAPYRTDEFYMLSYLNIAAFFGSWNVLLVKCVLEVIASSFISSEIAKLNWTSWLTYLLIVALVTTSISIEYWRQKALKQYHTGYVVAIFTVLQIAGGVILSAIFFEEFYGMKGYELALFFVGLILSFVGVGVVAYDRDTDKVDVIDDTVPMQKLDGDITVDDSSTDQEHSDNYDHKKSTSNLIENKDMYDIKHANDVGVAAVDDEDQQQTPDIGGTEINTLLET